MTLPGFTLTDTVSPLDRIKKMEERVKHIDQQIKELQDKKWIILSEMVDLNLIQTLGVS